MEDPMVFTCSVLPSDPRHLATVTNAYLGTRVYRNILHVNGVYNGAAGDTHRADIPSPVNVRMNVAAEESLSETFSLDTKTDKWQECLQGIIRTYIHSIQSLDYTATHRIYAHHSLVHLVAFSITIQRSTLSAEPITVNLHTQFAPESPDLDLHRGADFQGAHYVYGRTLVPEVEGGPQPTVHMIWTPVPQTVTLSEEEEEKCWDFLTAIAETEEDDTWMYPNILLFYPEAASAILKYRIKTLEGALFNAQKQGYKYWCSRVEWNSEEQNYHINGVMPPDEYHHAVNNSVYTNIVAKRSLNFASYLASQLQLPVPKEWKEVGEKIKVAFDKSRHYHPEYDGYCPGEQVKQADVVLLGFPVMYPMDPEVRRNDLEMYEPVTDPQGPAMTWSMFAVGWLELKETKRAQHQLSKCFSNITEPFKIWVENADGSGAVNFLTGMGGFLQAILFGYTGFRITKKHLYFDPICPEDIEQLKLTGVCYLGSKLNFTFTKKVITLKVTKSSSLLEAVLPGEGICYALNEGESVSFPVADGWIQKRTS
ncbi:hypothetical protein JD844_022060 [Phrynosoma platyrhinos]|uniref:Glycoside hydrolase family 65 central catalytic domain-containing protein n=1 Tax=Phrynosoma platyrhinos TaxID=52577 RepID=A0ABQ7SUW5_PHRPL|nr:hypothetical protein JD844_022060 [Phrynosoma platyrhinos]